eukprot:g21934.t1
MLRFLHAADLHLGMRLTRFSKDAINRIREARFEALENIRSEASQRDREYQFVILAGDLFDDVRVPREIAGRTFKLLESFPIPVIVISGNHDPSEPGSVTVEFETGGQRYRLMKRFSPRKDGEASLEQLSASGESTVIERGKEASREARRILNGEKSTEGLNQLLWLAQGSTTLPDPKDLDPSLKKRFEKVLGSMLTSHDMDFHDLLRENCKKYFSVNTGKESKKSPTTRLREEAESIEQSVQALQADVRNSDSLVSEYDRLTLELTELRSQVERSKSEITRLDAANEAAQSKRDALKQAQQHLDAAEIQNTEAAERLDKHSDLSKQLSNLEQTIRTTTADAAAADESQVKVEQEINTLEAELKTIRDDLSRLDDQTTELDEKRRLIEIGNLHAADTRIIDECDKLTDSLAQLRQELGRIVTADDKSLKKLRKNRREAEKLQAEIDAAALRLEIEPTSDSELKLRRDTQSTTEDVSTSNGVTQSWQFRQQVELSIESVGLIRIVRGETDFSLDDAARKLDRLNQEFGDVLSGFSIDADDESWMEILAARGQQRQSISDRIGDAESRLEERAPDGVEVLQGHLARLDAERNSILERAPLLAEWKLDSDELQRAQKDLDSLRKNARKRETEITGRLDEFRRQRDKDNDRLQSHRVNIATLKEKSDNLQKRLEELGTEFTLKQNLEAASQNLKAAKKHVAESALSPEEEQLEVRLEQERTALETRESRLQEIEKHAHGIKERLKERTGLHEKLAETEAELERVRAELAREERNMAAHRLLLETFEAVRDERVRRTVGPLENRVLTWTARLGLNEYQSVDFGSEDYLPTGFQQDAAENPVAISEESYGTIEQIALLIRLAAGRLLAKDEPHVAILDDPLTHADDSKHRLMIDILEEAITVLKAFTRTVCFITTITGIAASRHGDAADRPEIDVSVTVNFGRDTGQNFGTLFEARDKAGKTVFGAGFVGTYNTRYRADRYQLQFFVRPRKQPDRFQRRKMPRASTDSGIYLYHLRGNAFAEARGKDTTPRQWSSSENQWKDVPVSERTDHGGTLVRGKLLAMKAGRILYDGRVILDQPTIGRYLRLYFARNHLFFYHQHNVSSSNAFNNVVAVPWNPYADQLKVDLSKAIRLKTIYPREFPYAYGQFKSQVLSCSNIGGLYVFEAGKWRVLLKPDHRVSYQVYSMINFRDRLMMGQYPTGRILEYDGTRIIDRKNAPPVLAGVSTSAREAQTTTIYRGELIVGVWPWAEIWRLDSLTNRWVSMGRMFSQPELTRKTVHPYEAQAKKAQMVTNNLGQRVTALIPHEDSLLVGTSSKGGHAWSAKNRDILPDDAREEFGAIYRLTMPGNLAANIQWTEKPTTLRFLATGGRMSIQQDGREIGTTPISAALVEQLPKTRVVRACLQQYGTDKDGNARVFGAKHVVTVDLLKSRRKPKSHWKALLRSAGAGTDTPHYTVRNDLAVAMIHVGRTDEAISILKQIEVEEPGKYETAANLGTACELIGKNRDALNWIKEGMRRNPNSHSGTEWVHVKILEAKIAMESDSNWLKTHTVLGLDFGNELIPETPADVEETARAITYQLQERLQFVDAPDPIVAELLFDLANLIAIMGPVETAIPIYRFALEYGPQNSDLVASRIEHFEELVNQNSMSGITPGDLWLIGAIVVFIVLSVTLVVWYRRRHNSHTARYGTA